MGTRKVKMLEAMATQSGPQRTVGAIIEVSEAEAVRLVEKGYAVFEDGEPKRKKGE